MTDGDGDTVTDSVEVGHLVSFWDSNPTLTVNDDISFSNGDGGELTGLSVVEASGVQGAQTFTIEGPTYDDGAVDGYSTEVSYALVAVDGDDAGMTTSDSAGGEYAVTLDVVDGNTINGIYTDGQGAKQIAFTVSLSGDQITLTSFVALEHSNAPQGEGEDNTLDLGSLISVAATVTTTDGDGDVVANDTSAAQPLNLEFEDTNPTLTVNDDISFSNGDGGELTGLSVVEASGVQGAQTFTIEGPTYDDGAVDGYSTEVSYALVAVDGDDAGMTTSDSAGGEYAVRWTWSMATPSTVFTLTVKVPSRLPSRSA